MEFDEMKPIDSKHLDARIWKKDVVGTINDCPFPTLSTADAIQEYF